MMRKISAFFAIALVLCTFMGVQSFAADFSERESHIQESIGVKTTPDRQEDIHYPAPPQSETGVIRRSQESLIQEGVGVTTTPDRTAREEWVPPQTHTGRIRRDQQSLIQEGVGVQTTPEDRAGGVNIHRRGGGSTETLYGPRGYSEYYGQETTPGQFTSSAVVGRTIMNQRGETLGVVEDVVYGRDGRINYVIVTRGATAGARDRLVPIPWRTLRQGDREGFYVVNIDRDRFESAPSFSRAELPDFGSAEWNERVYGYYGVEWDDVR